MNAAQFLETVASLSLQAAIVIVAAGCIRRFGRLTAQAECRLWTCSHAVILTLTAIAATFPHLRLVIPEPLAAARAVSTVQTQLIAGRVLQAVWLTGVAVAGMSLVGGWICAARCLQSCRPIADDLVVSSGVAKVAAIGGRSVQFQTGPHVAGPCCWQFHRPYILLPNAVLGFPAGERQFIVQHELAHLRLGHPLQLFLQRLVEILYWFHPIVWWSARQAALAREFACDAAVVSSRSEIAGYLRTLLSVVEQTQSVGEPCRETIGFGVGSGVIALRARRLVTLAQSGDIGVETWIGRRLRPAAILLCGVACTLAWLPVNDLASSRSWLSPWPTWSAALARNVGVPARDYEAYDPRTQLFELRETAVEEGAATASR